MKHSPFPILVFAVVGAEVMPAQAGPWTQINVSGPSAREFSRMIYDSARGRAVLFGGSNGTSVLGDTWEWDGTAWAQVANAGPSPRYGHTMAFDSLRGVAVLHGGRTSVAASGETWSYDGVAWSLLSANGPAVVHGGMAYDSIRDRIVLCEDSVTSCGSLGGRQTWEWDGSSWQSRGQADHGYATSMAFDARRGRVVMDGGCGGLMEWNGASWVFIGGGTGPRAWASMAYDSFRGMIVTFGGYTTGTWYGSTVAYVGGRIVGAWGSGPSPRNRHVMAFDAIRRRVVLFGGESSGALLGDTWVFDPLPSATAETFGVGCGSPPLTMATSALPMLGETAVATLSNAPSPGVFVFYGWSRSQAGPFVLPLSLSGFGMPGCQMLQSTDSPALATSMTGADTARFALAVPLDRVFLGFEFYLQGWAYAPSANAAQAVVSNAIAWSIGF